MNSNEVFSQLTAAAVTVYALQSLKSSSLFPWVTQQTKAINRVLSAIGALIGAVGVRMAFAPATVDGTYVVTVTGLTFANVAAGLWHTVNQFATQQLLYDGIVSKTSAQTPQATTVVPQPEAVKQELRDAKLSQVNP